MTIILASASPRRKQLLDQIGCSYTIAVSDIIEDNAVDMIPADLAIMQAKAKALAVLNCSDVDAIVIGADTIVVLDGQVFGKPVDIDDARYMLTALSGREHQVITGVAVATKDQLWTDYMMTNVSIRHLTTAEIDCYIATGEPMDKAGAYAIQGIGALLVASIQGCYTNVVGLPLVTLSRLMARAGVKLL